MRKYIAEFIGTAMLVLIGCGSAVTANALFSALGMGLPVAFTTLATACAFGLAVCVLYYSMGSVSGGHLNPAVSFGMLITKRMSAVDFIGYVIAQFAGGIAGAALLSVIIGGRTSLGANGYDASSTFGVSVGIAFLLEAVLTFVFVSTFLSVTQKDEVKPLAGLIIGMAMGLVYIFSIPFTGGGINPARSFGPALLMGSSTLGQVWLFIAAPLVGALVAALIHMLLHGQPKEKSAEAVGIAIESTDELLDAQDEAEESETLAESENED